MRQARLKAPEHHEVDIQSVACSVSSDAKARCGYCSQPLLPGYYFCTGCAMPHTDAVAVLSEIHHPRWDTETTIRKQTPEVRRLFFTFLAVLIGCGVVGSFIFPEESADLPRFLFDILGLSFASLILAIHHRAILRPQLSGVGMLNSSFAFGLVLLGVLLAANFAWHGMFWNLSSKASRNHGLSDVVSLIPTVTGRVFLICVLPGIFEELGFRGLMQTWLFRVVSPWVAIIVSAALFSALHLNALSVPYLMLAGVLFGWVRWRTGMLLPAMVLHGLHNLVVLWHQRLLVSN